MLLIPPIEPSQSKKAQEPLQLRSRERQGRPEPGFDPEKRWFCTMLPTKNMLNMEITERTKRKIYSFNQEKVYLNQEKYSVLINEMVDAYIFAVTTLWISLDKLCISSCLKE